MGVSGGPGESGHGVNLELDWNWNSSNGRRSKGLGPGKGRVCDPGVQAGLGDITGRVPEKRVKQGEVGV